MNRSHFRVAPRSIGANAHAPKITSSPRQLGRARLLDATVGATKDEQPRIYEELANRLFAVVGGFRTAARMSPRRAPGFDDLVYRASLAGFHLLGSGYFSAVFSHSSTPGIAFKFGFKTEDSGAAYAAWSRENSGRACVPQIHLITRRAAGYVVVMKQYAPLFMRHSEPHIASQATELARVVQTGEQTRNTLSQEQYDTALGIHRFFDGIAEIDLHYDNMMIDPDTREIVITDPVSFTFDSVPKVDRQPGIRDAHQAILSRFIRTHQRKAIDVAASLAAKRIALHAVRPIEKPVPMKWVPPLCPPIYGKRESTRWHLPPPFIPHHSVAVDAMHKMAARIAEHLA
jgi:hypothetical protein